VPAPRPDRFLAVALAAAWIASALLAPPAHAGADDRLKEVERALGESREKAAALGKEAESLAAEATRLRTESVAAAKKAQDLESELSRLESEIPALESRETARVAALAAERDRLALLLAALERLARNPPAALLAEPGTPSDTVRSAILLRAAVPEVESRARALGVEIDEIARLRAGIAERRARLESAGKALAAERVRLARLAEEKARIESHKRAERRDEAKRAAALATKARSLRELLARIEEEARTRPPPAPPAPVLARPERAARPAPVPLRAGQGLPARGEIARRFGEDDRMGGRTKGIEIRTRPAAQVVAPADGEVVFAAPFRGYGQVLIIKTGQEYHALLGGLARIEAEVGQSVLAGEPVGAMQDSPGGEPVLYFELRRKGQPINPLPWLAARNSKVNG
jgi:murein hydrolase activator